MIQNILNGSLLGKGGYPAAGAVIDARGLSSSNTNMTCSGSPWGSGIGYLNVPSTILLPATSTTYPIQLSSTWVLPNGTKLIGEETTDPALNNGGAVPQTTIKASSTMASGTAMIQFGDSNCPSSVCTGISLGTPVLCWRTPSAIVFL